MNKHRLFFLESSAVAVLLVIAALLRFYEIRTRPGFEWDEPLYEAIARNVVKYGYPTLQVEEGKPWNPNLFHPPFDHYLKGYWFEITGLTGIGQARILAAIESLILLLLTYLLVRYLAGRETSILALLLISSDGWLIYTNRLNLLENAMMPIGVAGLCLYALAFKKDRVRYYVLAGVILALAAIYKHTGLYFLLVPILTWLLTRKAGEHHLVLFLVATNLILFYIAGMSYFFEGDYWFQTLVQVRRALGMVSSRGLTYGLPEVVQALNNGYWIFFVTIACLILGFAMVMIRFIQYFIRRQLHGNPILLNWSFAAILLLALVALKSPQYWIVMLVPLYAFLASELKQFFLRCRTALWAILSFVIVILGLNMTTWYFLIVHQANNALLETYNYASQFIPENARVLTEECIGIQLKQIYYNIQVHRDAEDLKRIKPNFVILYYSTTAKPPVSPGLNTLLQQSTLLREFSGFKEKIMIYKVESSKEVLPTIETPIVTTSMNTSAEFTAPITKEPALTIAPVITQKFIPTKTPEATWTPAPVQSTQILKPTLTETLVASPSPTHNPSVSKHTYYYVYYVVKKGDSLYELAQIFYGDWRKWWIIYKTNRKSIKNKNLIYTGQVLRIPK